MNKGDHVLATKYDDGDPGDQYCVGYYNGSYDHLGTTRYLVVDGAGKSFRANGFRRCEAITADEARWLISHFSEFKPLTVQEGQDDEEDKLVGKSVWDWLTECRAIGS